MKTKRIIRDLAIMVGVILFIFLCAIVFPRLVIPDSYGLNQNEYWEASSELQSEIFDNLFKQLFTIKAQPFRDSNYTIKANLYTYFGIKYATIDLDDFAKHLVPLN